MTYVDRVAIPALAVNARETSGNEPELVGRARQRDVRAFEQLYRAHVARIHGLCLRMTANPAQAEELTQKTFLAAWQKLPLFRGDSAFGSWLHRVAVNTVLTDQRAEQRRVRRVFGTEDPAAFEDSNPPPPPATAIRLDLEQAIAGLPRQARTVFVLHDVEGWRHEEIAEQLGVAVGTSKAQLHRARKLLQEALQ